MKYLKNLLHYSYNFLYYFKWIIILFVFLIILILENNLILNYAAKKAIEKSDQNVTFEKIYGGILSGLDIKKFNYQDSVKGDFYIEPNYFSLLKRTASINLLKVENLWIDEAFLTSLTQPKANEPKDENTSLEIPYIDDIKVENGVFSAENIKYQDYLLNFVTLKISDFYYDLKKDIKFTIDGNIDSNVVKANISANLKNENYIAKASLLPQNGYISTLLKDQNISFEPMPEIFLDTKGNFQQIDAKCIVEKGKIIYNDIIIKPEKLNLDAIYNIEKGDLDANLTAMINSNAAKIDLDSHMVLNINDLNETLNFNAKANLFPNKNYISKLSKEQNITIDKMPNLHINASGNTKKIDTILHINQGNITYGDFKIKPQNIDIKAVYEPLKQELKANFQTDINSNIANIDINSNVSLNAADINNTLTYRSNGKIAVSNEYLQTVLKDQNITLNKLTMLTLLVNGDAKELKADFDIDGDVDYNGINVKPKIADSNAVYHFTSNALDAILNLDLNSSLGKAKANIKTFLDLDDINNTLEYNAKLEAKEIKEYQGIDLSSLGNLLLKAKGSLKKVDATLESPKINMSVKSKDFDKFNLNLNSKEIYIGKIYQNIDKELKESYVSLKTNGFCKLSNQSGKFTSQIKGAKFNKNIIKSNSFDLQLNKEDIKLSNLVLTSKDFKLSIDAKKVKENISADIKNKTFFAKVNARTEPLKLKADAQIGSIDAMIKEINKIYPLEIGIKVDGKVDLKADMVQDDIKIKLNSNEIVFDEGKIKDLLILALYGKDKIILKNFDFETRNFEQKSFNRKFNLKKEGIIKLKGENAVIDVEFDNLLKIKGEKTGEDLHAGIKLQELFLAHKEYGETKISSDIKIEKVKEKIAATGKISFSDTKIIYESKFMDVSKDSDIIIITKDDKKQKERDTFIENIYLDLSIQSKDNMIYKVEDGEIEFIPDIKVKKIYMGKPVITGKIKVADGYYDFSDKRFDIEEGAIAFRGQEDINPLLDLNVKYDEIEDVLIKIKIGGDKNRPKLNFSSEPFMSKKDIVSYILFGVPVSEPAIGSSAKNAASKIFSRAISKDLAQEMNLDRLDLSQGDKGGVNIKAGKKLNKKTFIYYQNKNQESSVIVERKLHKNWEIETEVGKSGSSVDLIFKKGFK